MRAESAAPGRPAPASQTVNKYRAVQVRPQLDSCGAVDKVKGKRFLVSAAPMLPLPECDIEACGCRYDKFDDRRGGGDRRVIAQNRHVFHAGEERRQDDGRRSSD